MKTRLQQFLILLWVAAFLLVPIAQTISNATAAEIAPTNGIPMNIAEELRRFREEIEEQGRRIDRLYRALGPHMKELEARAARQKQQDEEDKLLALERIVDTADQGLSGQGCAN